MEGSEEAVETKLNLLIGVTGSVATIKLSPLVTALMALNTYNIRVIATEKASGFIDSITTSLLRSNWVELLTDSNEWGQWKQKGNTVLHIELRKWADIFVIAPLSANTLAKLTNGLCDNLLTCVARAWDLKPTGERVELLGKSHKLLKQPIVVAPAMNTLMLEHPITEKQFAQLREWNYIVIPTVEKLLACGDRGLGAMEEVQKIVEVIQSLKEVVLKSKSESKAKGITS